jgi:hypothetical protein
LVAATGLSAGGGHMFVCGVPKNITEFLSVLNFEEDQFGEFSIPLKMARNIFAFRPEIYLAVTALDGTVAAYSSVYPLKKKWADAFIAGDIAEPDLTPDMLLSRQDALDGTCIYIGSIVVGRNYDPFSKSVLLASLFFWRAQQLQDASVKRITAIMTPVTKHGERLVRYVGAKRLGTNTDVNDHGIYSREVSPSFLYRITSSVERFLSNSMVEMNLNFRPPLLPASNVSNQSGAVSRSPERI